MKRKSISKCVCAWLILMSWFLVVFCEEAAFAAEPQINPGADQWQPIVDHLNMIWVLVCAALVFLMQAGFMCVEAGLAQAKHSINVAVKNLADFVLAAVVFWLFGFGLMFGESQSGLFGTSDFLISLDDPWITVFFVFQSVFVGTAATIDSGAVAGRTRFLSYLVLSTLISCLVYPVFGHWAWGGLLHSGQSGWLEAMGFIDFAGSTVVHSTGGWVALAGIIVVGPRLHKFDADGKPRRIHPHNLTLTYLGAFILFFGWFGFNCGSTLEASNDVPGIALNTMLAASFGCISASALSWVTSPYKRPEGEMIANGLLGGLVGITAGCASVETTGAMVIGLVSGIIVYFAVGFIEKTLKLDDVVGAVAVHGFCGAWGTVAVALFITQEHLGQTGRLNQLFVQVIGVLTCFAWTFGVSFILLKIINKLSGGLRVSREDEEKGLNITEHGAQMPWQETIDAIQYVVSTGDVTKRVSTDDGDELSIVAYYFNLLLDEVQNAVEAVDKVARGDLDLDIRPKSDQDTLGLATRSMVENLRTLIDGIDRITGVLMSSSRQLDDSGEELKDANGLLRERVGEVTQNLNVTMTSVLEMVDLAEEGSGEAREKVRSDMADFGQGQTRLVETIHQLADHSRAISGFAQTINDIADQTSILAINAAIQAAHSGEHGRAFGVVAGEVRELAEKAREASSEIKELITQISGETETVIFDAEACKDSSSRVSEDIETTLGGSLGKIKGLGVNVSGKIDSINNAARGQQEALDRTHEAIEKNFSVSSSLNRQIQNLKQAVHEFRENGSTEPEPAT